MRIFTTFATSVAGLTIFALAAPAVAQPAPYGGYNQNGVLGSVLDSVLGGGRYGAYGTGPESRGVDQCARAAENRVNNDFRSGRFGAYRQGYDNRYNNSSYNRPANVQVVGITSVERKSNGLKVSGLIETGMQYSGRNTNQAYGNQGYDPRYNNPRYNDPRVGQPAYNQAYGNQAYGYNAQYADLLFSCRVDVRGQVMNLSVKRANGRRI